MTKTQLLKVFQGINTKYKGDEEVIHIKMDEALLRYVNSPQVRAEYEKEEKWCA